MLKSQLQKSRGNKSFLGQKYYENYNPFRGYLDKGMERGK